MKINDQFSPHLANVLQPSKENSLTILGKGVTDFMKQRDDADIKAINEDSIREKIRASKSADSRADTQLQLNQQQTDSNIKIADANIDFKSLGQTFDHELKNKTFDFNKESTLWGQGQKLKEFKLSEKKVKADINQGNKSLGMQQQRLNITKQRANKSSKKTSSNNSTPVKSNINELNKKIAKTENKTERTIVRSGMQNGKRVVQYSDGSVEHGN